MWWIFSGVVIWSFLQIGLAQDNESGQWLGQTQEVYEEMCDCAFELRRHLCEKNGVQFDASDPDMRKPIFTDIILDVELCHLCLDAMKDEQDVQGPRRQKRSLIYDFTLPANINRKWPGPFDVNPIQYDFDEAVSPEARAVIEEAIEEYHNKTCIRFERNESLADEGIIFMNSNTSGCVSSLGRIPATFQPQRINLNEDQGCANVKAVPLHEIAHALGVFHEQSRPDRAMYVNVIFENIIQGFEHNFAVGMGVTTKGLPYDYHSVMHYGPTFFGINNSITIETTDPKFQNVIGLAPCLSFFDVKLINLCYCNDTCNTSTVTCENNGYVAEPNCSKCICPDGLGGPACEGVDTSCDTGCDPNSNVLFAPDTFACVSSESFPSIYAVPSKCNWLIKTTPGCQIEIIFQTSITSYTNGACPHYLEIRSDDISLPGPRYCGVTLQDVGNATRTTQGMVLILFRALKNVHAGFGFQVCVKRVCPTTPKIPPTTKTTTTPPTPTPNIFDNTTTTTTTSTTTTTTPPPPTTTTTPPANTTTTQPTTTTTTPPANTTTTTTTSTTTTTTAPPTPTTPADTTTITTPPTTTTTTIPTTTTPTLTKKCPRLLECCWLRDAKRALRRASK